jgi:hypothetical protein
MSSCSRRIILSMLEVEFNNFISLPAVGASGGIIVAWRARVDAALNFRLDTYGASAQFVFELGELWWLTCVYGPQDNDGKIAFLQEIRSIQLQCTGPWLLGGISI